jgi:hypothetical protein
VKLWKILTLRKELALSIAPSKGAAILVASGSGGSTSPSLVERLEEPNLRRLLEEAAATASLLKQTLNHLLAATAG